MCRVLESISKTKYKAGTSFLSIFLISVNHAIQLCYLLMTVYSVVVCMGYSHDPKTKRPRIVEHLSFHENVGAKVIISYSIDVTKYAKSLLLRLFISQSVLIFYDDLGVQSNIDTRFNPSKIPKIAHHSVLIY